MGPTTRRALRVLVVGTHVDAAEMDPAFKWESTPFSVARWIAADPPLARFDVAVMMCTQLARPERPSRVREFVGELRALAPELKVIAAVGPRDSATAAAALDGGAWDVVRRDQAGHLGERLRRLASTHYPEPEAGGRDESGWQEMIGTSPKMLDVFALIRRVAASEVPVLLVGESGTGKELAARAIHERSERAPGPFAPINCASIPEGLLESELFGHERGAFTGAFRTTKGRIETAHRGTLFLDEITEAPPSFQVKLLRFLEDHMVDRVGSASRRPVDVRVIAATNRDPAELIRYKLFRDDLYYRLAVMQIHLPPLRERLEDALLMGRLFLRRYADLAGRRLDGFAPDAIEALWSWRWPGNVRELINRVRRAVIASDGPLVSASDLDFHRLDLEGRIPTLREALHESEHRALDLALQRARGNRSEAARLLRVSRSTLYELLERHRLDGQTSGVRTVGRSASGEESER